MKIMNGLDLQNQRIQALADPSSATDAATKQYVDALIAGLSWKNEVRVATTTNGALATAYENGDTVDGVTLATGDRILLKDQTTQSENGIYVVAASGAPTRATDADSTAELNNAAVYVTSGTVNAGRQYTQTTQNPTVGSSNIVWAQVTTGGSTYTAGNGLSESPAGTFNVDTGTASSTGLEISTDQVRIAAAAAGNGLTGGGGSALAVGAGTGITVAADAVSVDTSVVARKFSASIGNGSATSIAVTHNLGTKDVVVEFRLNADDSMVITDWVATDTNTVTASFATAPASNAVRVTVIG